MLFPNLLSYLDTPSWGFSNLPNISCPSVWYFLGGKIWQTFSICVCYVFCVCVFVMFYNNASLITKVGVPRRRLKSWYRRIVGQTPLWGWSYKLNSKSRNMVVSLIMSWHWDGADSWHQCSWKIRSHLPRAINIMDAGGLTTQWARTSAAMVLPNFPGIFRFQHQKCLVTSY